MYKEVSVTYKLVIILLLLLLLLLLFVSGRVHVQFLKLVTNNAVCLFAEFVIVNK